SFGPLPCGAVSDESTGQGRPRARCGDAGGEGELRALLRRLQLLPRLLRRLLCPLSRGEAAVCPDRLRAPEQAAAARVRPAADLPEPGAHRAERPHASRRAAQPPRLGHPSGAVCALHRELDCDRAAQRSGVQLRGRASLAGDAGPGRGLHAGEVLSAASPHPERVEDHRRVERLLHHGTDGGLRRPKLATTISAKLTPSPTPMPCSVCSTSGPPPPTSVATKIHSPNWGALKTKRAASPATSPPPTIKGSGYRLTRCSSRPPGAMSRSGSRNELPRQDPPRSGR